MQQQKHLKHPIHNLETGGTVVVSMPLHHQKSVAPGPQNILLFLGIFLIGILPGIAIGMASSEKKVSAAQDAAKLEQIQRQQLQQQVGKFCKDFAR